MRSLAPNSLILTGSNLLNAALGFLLSLIIGRGLGASGFGIWVFCLAWASLLTMVCEFGLNSLVTRDAARRPEKSNRLLFLSLVLKLILVSLLGGSVAIFSPFLALDSGSSTALQFSMLIVLASVAYGSFTAIFRSTGWMWPILWLNLAGGIIQVAWSAWIIRSGGGVLPLIWAALGVDFGQIFTATILWWKKLRPYGGGLKISRVEVIQMARDALPFAISAFLGAIEARSSVLLLGYLRGEREVGQFGMASRFFEAARLLPNGIYDAAFPAFAAEKSTTTSDRSSFRWIQQIILIYAIIVSLALFLLPRQVIRLTYGVSFLSATATLSLLGIALLPTLRNAVMEVYLFATGDERYATNLGFFGLAVQVLASVPLAWVYGAEGAATGILIGELAIWLPLQLRLKKLSL